MGKTSHHNLRKTTAKSNSSSASKNQPVEFIQHVHEFRSRIFWVALLFIVSSALAYQFRDILIHLVLSPLGDEKLIYLNPAGGFSFIFLVTMYAGAVVTAPFLTYQLYRFVTPALPVRARKHAALIFITAMLLMCAGVLFGYLVAVPSALSFLTTFAGDYVSASLTADSYLNFIIAYVVGLGILFQLPLLLIFWHWIKPLTPGQLFSSERFMIVFSFIAAAVITPTPDVVNQLLIAGPILLIYQMGVITVLIMIRKERKLARRRARASGIGEGIQRPVLSHELPSLAMPSLDELVPQKSAIPTIAQVRPRPLTKTLQAMPAPINVPKPIPVMKPAPSVMSRPAPVAATTSRPRLNVTYRSRPSVVVRPLPIVARRETVSLDGFLVTS